MYPNILYTMLPVHTLCAVPQKIACNFLISEGNNIELPCGNLILFQNHGTAHRPFPTQTPFQIPIYRVKASPQHLQRAAGGRSR